MNSAHEMLDVGLPELLEAMAPGLRCYMIKHTPPRFRELIHPDDLLQEVWLAAYVARFKFEDFGNGSVQRWVQTIAHNKLVDALRTAQTLKRGGFGRPPCDEGNHEYASLQPTPSRVTAAKEIETAIRAGLTELPDDQREVMTLYYLNGMPVHEVARCMNRSTQAIGGLLFRAMGNLRVHLGNAGRYLSDAPSTIDTVSGTGQ